MSSTGLPVSTVKPPRVSTSALDWLRRNLFNGWANSLITVVLLWAIASILMSMFDWVLNDATWTPIARNLRLFWAGRYPPQEVERLQIALALVLLLFGLSAGIWGGLMRGIAIGLAAAALLLALLPFDFGTRLFLAGLVLLVGAGYAAGLSQPARLRWPAVILWLASPLVVVLLVRGVTLAGLLGLGIRLFIADVMLLVVVGLAVGLWQRPRLPWPAIILWLAAPLIVVALVAIIASAGLRHVSTDLWGGLLLTIMLAVVGIVASFPLGVLLALGRRGGLPVVRMFCVAYIELIRGVPLITVLYMAQLMLPLFLPGNIRVDHLVRAMVAITLFSAAYLAENVRGGLQAVPNGQVEAARALGLNVFQTTTLIVLPQALRAVIPAIVGQFISLFKDTSLVAIVGLFDLLGMAILVYKQPEWLTVTGGVQREVLFFAAAIYWIFCFSMARISGRIETRLGVGVR